MRITDLLRRSDSSDNTLSRAMYLRMKKRLEPCYCVDYELGKDRDQDGMLWVDGEQIPFKEHPDFAAIKRCEAYCEAAGIKVEPIVVNCIYVQPSEPPPEVQERRPGDPIPAGLSRVVEDRDPRHAEDTPERAERPETDAQVSEADEATETPESDLRPAYPLDGDGEPTEADGFVIDGIRYESMDDYGAHQGGAGIVRYGRWFADQGACNAWVRATAHDGMAGARASKVLRDTGWMRTFN